MVGVQLKCPGSSVVCGRHGASNAVEGEGVSAVALQAMHGASPKRAIVTGLSSRHVSVSFRDLGF